MLLLIHAGMVESRGQARERNPGEVKSLRTRIGILEQL
jgi:hypothetical protein